MIDFYDSNKANRAINTYLDFVGTDKVENKELLILTLVAYLEKTTQYYIKRVMGVDINSAVRKLADKGYITNERNGKECSVKINYTPTNSEVFSESIMYVFSNALFNIGKYVKDFKITSWNTLASLVELPLNIGNNGYINYEYDMLNCIGGGKPNKIYNRQKLVKIGAIKGVGSSQTHTYRLNQHAYLLGAK